MASPGGSRCRGCHRARRRATYDSAAWRSLPSPRGRACTLRIKCDGAPATSWHHVTPLAKGGGHERANLVPACIACNSSKRDRL
ncbi:hypothetical protein BST36_20790 [Mycolicibacterium moriokaense]|nr:hypothetical protein BST36_20790 [Mycolicibacterium moriokaense]